MKKNIILGAFLVFNILLCTSQNDTIASTNINIRFDSIHNVQKFYKKKNPIVTFTNDPDDFIEIEKGVISYSNGYEIIVNGISIKTVSDKSEKQSRFVTHRDHSGKTIANVICKENKISLVELFKDGQIFKRYHFGLTTFKESFEYNEDKYILTVDYHDRVIIYELIRDITTNEFIKSKIREEEKVDIIIDNDGKNYIVNNEDYSYIYDKYKSSCND